MTTEQPLCPQCFANAQWNDAAGYPVAAQDCRDYCRRGHKTLAMHLAQLASYKGTEDPVELARHLVGWMRDQVGPNVFGSATWFRARCNEFTEVVPKLLAQIAELQHSREHQAGVVKRTRQAMFAAVEALDDTARAAMYAACRNSKCPCFCGAHISQVDV